ncbi:hypothetical protein B0H13DRAFT_2359180 [Mycena leptocephala]|nr:hypothetical protein B0H13DRAFT_2359180 [Mycena leptocephala]
MAPSGTVSKPSTTRWTSRFSRRVRCSHSWRPGLLSGYIIGSKGTSIPATTVATHVPAATVARATQASVVTFGQLTLGAGRKAPKRKAHVELVSGPVKRSSGKPDKSAFHHWVCVGP